MFSLVKKCSPIRYFFSLVTCRRFLSSPVEHEHDSIKMLTLFFLLPPDSGVSVVCEDLAHKSQSETSCLTGRANLSSSFDLNSVVAFFNPGLVELDISDMNKRFIPVWMNQLYKTTVQTYTTTLCVCSSWDELNLGAWVDFGINTICSHRVCLRFACAACLFLPRRMTCSVGLAGSLGICLVVKLSGLEASLLFGNSIIFLNSVKKRGYSSIRGSRSLLNWHFGVYSIAVACLEN